MAVICGAEWRKYLRREGNLFRRTGVEKDTGEINDISFNRAKRLYKRKDEKRMTS